MEPLSAPVVLVLLAETRHPLARFEPQQSEVWSCDPALEKRAGAAGESGGSVDRPEHPVGTTLPLVSIPRKFSIAGVEPALSNFLILVAQQLTPIQFRQHFKPLRGSLSIFGRDEQFLARSETASASIAGGRLPGIPVNGGEQQDQPGHADQHARRGHKAVMNRRTRVRR
jgi:hypothetical protein